MGKAVGSYPRSWMEISAGSKDAEQGYEPPWKRRVTMSPVCSLKEETLLDHILTRYMYYHELHLAQESLLDSSKLMVILSDLHLDILSKFKGIFGHCH